MGMFIGHIALILNVMALAAGLVALHHNAKIRAKFLGYAGWLLIVFGLLGTGCTSYFMAKYYFHGHFEHAYDFKMTMEGNGPHYHCSGSVGD